MRIDYLEGTCANEGISLLAEKPGRKSSWKNACRMIKNYSTELAEQLALDFWNPWDYETNIKTIDGVKYLHIVHSQIDYIFRLTN